MDKSEKIKDIIYEQLGVSRDEVVASARIVEDLGGDFLDAVTLVFALEEEFNIEIPDEDAERLLTVGDIIDYVEKKTAGK